MKILYSPASPYSAKVRMAAALAELDIESVTVDTNAEPEILIGNNPLGKIPTLITDSGQAIYDSRAITQFLNRESGGKLFPGGSVARDEAEVMEALADGICDCLLAVVYEKRFRPEDMHYQPWIDKQWSKAGRALDQLSQEPPSLDAGLHAGHLAIAALLSYLDLRFAGQFEAGRDALKNWQREFAGKFPKYDELKSQG